MSAEHRELITALFGRLRRAGFRLGVGELLDAHRALEGGWPVTSDQDLLDLARLLFCDSLNDARELERVWPEVRALWQPLPPAPAGEQPEVERRKAERMRREHERAEVIERTQAPSPRPESAPPAAPALAALPLLAPEPGPADDGPPDMQHSWPLTRRALIYAWRFLRRPVADGPPDVLDVRATVERAARQGFFLAPVYRRRARNSAHLLLLVDQGGSMTPFHRFTRDIVDTARDYGGIGRVDVRYFRNVPPAEPSEGPGGAARPELVVFEDPFLTKRADLSAVLAECDADTSTVVVSDAGAARGYQRLDRLQRTRVFLARLRERTSLVAWLNPMPEARWLGSTAQLIAYTVPMFPLEPDALAAAIDVVRGAPLRHIL